MNYKMAFENVGLRLDYFFLDSRNWSSLSFFIKEKEQLSLKIYYFLCIPW